VALTVATGSEILTKDRSLLIDEMTSTSVISSRAPPVAFFYCAKETAEPERSRPTEVLLSIARQLSGDDPEYSIRLPLITTYNKHYDFGVKPRRLESSECVELILALTDENPATIIIDALDECDAAHRYILMDALDEIMQRSSNIVKIFISSRDDGDIVCRLSGSPNLYISVEDNQEDIESFIDNQMEIAIASKRLLRGRVSEELASDISQTLKRDAQGM